MAPMSIWSPLDAAKPTLQLLASVPMGSGLSLKGTSHSPSKRVIRGRELAPQQPPFHSL